MTGGEVITTVNVEEVTAESPISEMFLRPAEVLRLTVDRGGAWGDILIPLHKIQVRRHVIGLPGKETLMNRRMLPVLSLAVLVVTLTAGCSGDDEMSRNASLLPTGSVELASADIRIGDQSVTNATIPPGSGTATLFTASLADPSDGARVMRMQMDYPLHSSMGMMGGSSSVSCYDDGTHGDAVAGDGTYSYQDTDQHIGPHQQDCAPGTYVYTFHGTDMMGKHTNEIVCRVTVQ